jgi:hypothetical protein
MLPTLNQRCSDSDEPQNSGEKVPDEGHSCTLLKILGSFFQNVNPDDGVSDQL